ncbi:hypothetical protein FOZ60_014586 [Perkinsus olseni]|uniref:Uncharacterized protein n=1 Tax=Perkinsus olseni TaxID=32597 RepID=A0A7J6N9Y6_PEROL|nr:hypothetical protein FOZ60_014586 [Perkinsus olseni]
MRLGVAAIAVFSAVLISPTEGSFFKRRRGTWKDKNALAGEIAAGEIATGEMEEKKKDGKSKDSYDPTKEQEKRDKQVKLKNQLDIPSKNLVCPGLMLTEMQPVVEGTYLGDVLMKGLTGLSLPLVGTNLASDMSLAGEHLQRANIHFPPTPCFIHNPMRLDITAVAAVLSAVVINPSEGSSSLRKLTKKKGDSQPKVDKPKAESPPKEGYDDIPSTPKRVRILNSNSPGWHYSGRPAEEPDSTAHDTSE